MRLPPQPPKTCSRVTPWTAEGDEVDGAEGVEGAVNAVTSMGGFRTGAPAAKASTGVASDVAITTAQTQRHMEVSPGITKANIVASTTPFNGRSRAHPGAVVGRWNRMLYVIESSSRSFDRHRRPLSFIDGFHVAWYAVAELDIVSPWPADAAKP
jgi:hypothetical protein